MLRTLPLTLCLLATLGCGDTDRGASDGTRDDGRDTSDGLEDDSAAPDTEVVAEDGVDAIDEVGPDALDAVEVPDTADTADTADVAGEVDLVDAIDGTDTADTDEPEIADSASDADDVQGSTEPLDPDLVPCDAPEYWPFSVASRRVPVRVHYRVPADAAMASDVLTLLEHDWEVEVGTLGFDAPLDDGGTCGPDGDFDVFLWRDAEDVYVDVYGENDATPWDDGYPYMVVDPWGEFGGDELPVTLAHELNHACQASYDWSDAAFIYEATSTQIEDEVYDERDSYLTILFDFQGNPEWSLDRDDGYATWYMYGASLWLRYLRDRFFHGDASFLADLWAGLRSPAGDDEPDYADSVDALLAPFGRSFGDTVIEFARWRWYVGERDDGRHLEEAGAFPPDALPRVAATVPASGGSAAVETMMLGTAYVDIAPGAGGALSVTLASAAPAGAVNWVVQALPGLDGSDGDLLTLPAEVSLIAGEGRTIAVTALPGPLRDIDPEARTDERFPVTLELRPR